MNIKNLLYITAIAEEGSLSKAGRKLGISQPTLSIFLSNLETNLGVDLFLRDKKQLIPTPAGKLYLDAAKRIIMVKNQTYQTIHSLTHEPTETITVGVTPLRGSIMVAQIFPQFSRRFPNVKLVIREAYMKELRKLAQSGEVNYSLGSCYDAEVPDLDYVIISKEEVVLGIPSFHRLAPLASDSLHQLTPRYYLNLAIILAKNRILTEAERYFAYLVIKRDTNNPMYVPSGNAYTRTILQEFDEKELSL